MEERVEALTRQVEALGNAQAASARNLEAEKIAFTDSMNLAFAGIENSLNNIVQEAKAEFAKIQTWSDGKLVAVDEFTTILDPEKDGQGILILAQEQDSFGEGFDKKQSFIGNIAQFNIFGR